jgi:transmembrane sensor
MSLAMGPDEATREAAGHWFAVLRRGPMSLDERQAFDAWRAEPLNQRALDRMHELWGELSGLKALAPEMPRRSRVGGRAMAGLAAAGVVLSVGGAAGLWTYTQGRGEAVSTKIGEQQTKSLPDGSVVALNVVTSINYRMKPHQRSVRLDEGQAAFFVRKDKTRPFLVDAGDYEVRAVGTAFDVRRRDGTVDVAVSEGVVSVKALRGPRAGEDLVRLAAGQRLRLPSADQPGPLNVIPVPIDSVAEWRMRVVDYEDATVATVAADLSRFYQRPVTVSDSTLARRRVTLRLQVNEREQTLRTLTELLGAKIDRGAASDALSPSV